MYTHPKISAPSLATQRETTRPWMRLRRAVQVAEQVRQAVSGPGLEQEVARQVAYLLADAAPATRRWALALFSLRAAKTVRVTDRKRVLRVWAEVDHLDQVVTPAPRPLTPKRQPRHERLPIEEARAVPLDRLLRSLGFDLRRVGRQWVTHCPFHDDRHPSLTIDIEKGLWFCFPCGIGGDGIALIERLKRTTFVEAMREVVRCF